MATDNNVSLPEWARIHNIPLIRAKKLVRNGDIPIIQEIKSGRGTDYIVSKLVVPPKSDEIRCMICGTEFLQIAERHVKLHGMTLTRYKELFPDAPLFSESVKAKVSQSKIGHEVTPAMREASSRANTGNTYSVGRVVSQETKDKISRSNTGKKRSSEQRVSMSETRIGMTHSEVTIQKMRDTHASRSPEDKQAIIQKMDETSFQRYGVKKPSQHPDIIEKIKQTHIEKYGDWFLATDHAKALIKDIQEKNGGHPSRREASVAKRIETNMARHGQPYTMHIAREAFKTLTGFDNPFEMQEYQDKAKETMRFKTGYDHALQNPFTLHKMQQSYFEKTGFFNPAKNPEVQDRILATNWEKYNRKNVMQIHFSEELCEFLENKDEFVAYMGNTSIRDASIDLKMGYDTVRKYCDKYGIERPRSSYETAIRGHLAEWGITTHGSDRTLIKPLEIDIVAPDLKIGIEFCGLYWHTENFKPDRSYHKTKLDAAEAANYRLITIFEDEWLYKKEIVLTRLKHIFGKSEIGIAARKCQIKEIPAPIVREFYDQYHIQGMGQYGFINYGAFYNDELVGAMTFGPARFGKEDGIELYRFATDGKTHSGLASKMFNHFLREFNPYRVFSYADRRWSNGDVYRQLGFKEVERTDAGYAYFNQNKGVKRESRWNFQKSMLPEKLTIFDPDFSEYENMKMNGYDRIYDCGNYKFVWEPK